MPGRGGKKSRTGGKSRGVARRGRSNAGSSPKSYNYRSSPDGREDTTFTLRDAARSQHGPSSWSTSLNLRHRSIGFIRSDEPTEFDKYKKSEASKTDDGVVEDDQSAFDAVNEAQSYRSTPEMFAQDKEDIPAFATTVPIGLQTRNDGRPSSSAGSDASEDIVLFNGRNSNARQQFHRVKESTPRPGATRVRVVDDPLDQTSIAVGRQDDLVANKPVVAPSYIASSSEQAKLPRDLNTIHNIVLFSPYTPLASRGKPRQKQPKQDVNELGPESMSHSRDDLNDYIENMRENGTSDELVNMSFPSETQDDNEGWDSSDLKDFDELSTSDEVLESVQQILSKRHRPTGLQYLVVWEGTTVDDARWIPHILLSMEGAATIIAEFEEKERNIVEYPADSDEDESMEGDADEPDEEASDDPEADDNEDGSDSTGGDLSVNSDDDFEDDRDLIERRLARLEDEELARLLAKQEELGLGSDELVIYDGMFADDDVENESDLELEIALQASRQRTKKRQKHSKRRSEFSGGFDEVMMLADDGDDGYGDFDVVDRERPSIAGSSKNKGNPVTWGLSDSDQAATLRDVWEADRSKKKARKMEREELRAQGLLGKKNKFKPDLSAKYRDGMDVDQIGEELRTFLFSTAESRALPPMDKSERKVIHEIASVFGLKSLSKGSGKKRFPTLQKTSKTVDFDDEVFNRLRRKLERSFFPRMDRKTTRSGIVRRGKGRGSGIGDAFSYRHGDVVGGTAPEIGAENRGHAMLSKMGWKLGEQLGGNNKGILTPIAHIVRSSRAGLG